MDDSAYKPPSSPCIMVCEIHLKSGLCYGCGRSRQEIALWGRMSEPERKAVMASLKDRMETAGLEPRREP